MYYVGLSVRSFPSIRKWSATAVCNLELFCFNVNTTWQIFVRSLTIPSRVWLSAAPGFGLGAASSTTIKQTAILSKTKSKFQCIPLGERPIQPSLKGCNFKVLLQTYLKPIVCCLKIVKWKLSLMTERSIFTNYRYQASLTTSVCQSLQNARTGRSSLGD